MAFQRIVFLQGDEAIEPINILNNEGKDAAINYLAQWDMGDRGEVMDELAAGSSDSTYEAGDYLLSWNTGLEYIGLERRV